MAIRLHPPTGRTREAVARLGALQSNAGGEVIARSALPRKARRETIITTGVAHGSPKGM